MKRFRILILSLLLLSLLPATALAQEMVGTYNPFLAELPPNSGLRGFYCYARTDTPAYESPEDPTELTQLTQGTCYWIQTIYTDGHDRYWAAVCDGSDEQFLGWAALDYFLPRLDQYSFPLFFAQEITPQTGSLDSQEYPEPILLYTCPGGHVRTLLTDPSDSVSYQAIYTDSLGLHWGMTTLPVSSGDPEPAWVCLDQPTAYFYELYPDRLPGAVGVLDPGYTLPLVPIVPGSPAPWTQLLPYLVLTGVLSALAGLVIGLFLSRRKSE